MKYIFINILILTSLVGRSQQSQETFGKNRLQHKRFDWRYYSSENFDVYFYGKGGKVARKAIDFLEDEFEQVTDLIGYLPYAKTKIFLYSSIADVQQSNIGLSDAKYGIGGETTFVKFHIEVANPGNVDELKTELLLRFTQLMINDMLFGGSLKDMFQNTYLLNLPAWFVEGISQYIAKGWNEEMDDYVRELVASGDVKKLRAFTGDDATIIGHSIWNYIAEKYGRSTLSNILNYTRIMRNEEKSITVTIGVGFKQLIYDWQQYYKGHTQVISTSYVSPDEELLQMKKNRKMLDYSQVKVSPDGKRVAYVVRKQGKYCVNIKNIETGEVKEIFSGGYKVINQQVDKQIPVIDWSDDTNLGIINRKKGKLLFWLYDVQSKSKFSRELTKLTNVKSLEFSQNGRLAVVSADIDGKNDIFLLSTRRDRTKRLTNDWYDDITPSFVPSTNIIVFSSNRTSDTVDVRKDVKISEVADNFNLFFYSLDTTKNVLHRVTNTLARDYYPYAKSPNEIYYLSDQKGVTNLMKYNLQSKIYQQVTNFQYRIHDYDINFDHKSIAYVMNKDQRDAIYLDTSFDYNASRFTPANVRKQLIQAKLISKKKSIDQQENKPDENPQEKSPADSVQIDTDIIDTDSFIFDAEVKETSPENKSFLSQYKTLQVKDKVRGPFPYQNRFSWDNITTSWLIDPLIGFGILLETEMNDMLENHLIKGGMMFKTCFCEGIVHLDYKYLRERIDYSFRFERKVILEENSNFIERYLKNTFQVGASYPFDVRTKLSIEPFYTNTRYDDLFPFDPTTRGRFQGFAPSVRDQYTGARVSLVYDNSTVKELNYREGTRAKISLVHHESLTNSARTFSNVSIDVRHYQKIHRQIILAGRLFYGRFTGDNPPKYLLGGVDNWLFNKSDRVKGGPLDLNTSAFNDAGVPTTFVTTKGDYNAYQQLFSEFATSLRGFNYGVAIGNNVMLANVELRIPIIRYLHNGPISSNFFRNLQFTGFYDIGASWTGRSPFTGEGFEESPLIKIPGNPFSYTVIDYKSPWLYSYGVGLRTVFLGYYLKFDVAWPVLNFVTKKPRLTVSLGLDF